MQNLRHWAVQAEAEGAVVRLLLQKVCDYVKKSTMPRMRAHMRGQLVVLAVLVVLVLWMAQVV